MGGATRQKSTVSQDVDRPPATATGPRTENPLRLSNSSGIGATAFQREYDTGKVAPATEILFPYCRVSTLWQTSENQRNEMQDRCVISFWHEEAISRAVAAAKRPSWQQQLSRP